MKTFNLNSLSEQQRRQLIQRPKMDFTSIFGIVQPIIDEVEQRGDTAVLAFTEQFDNISLEKTTISPNDLETNLEDDVKSAIDVAFSNIKAFHEAQVQPLLELETMPGVRCRKVMKPIERVGLYVPGGTAILPSTAMMLSIPAMIAGCTTIVLATPPNAEGRVPDEVLYIAQKAGVTDILLAGGAQAVAANGIWNGICTKSG